MMDAFLLAALLLPLTGWSTTVLQVDSTLLPSQEELRTHALTVTMVTWPDILFETDDPIINLWRPLLSAGNLQDSGCSCAALCADAKL